MAFWYNVDFLKLHSMKTEEKTYNHKVRNAAPSQQEKTLFPEKLALAKKQLKGVKLPPNKNSKEQKF